MRYYTGTACPEAEAMDLGLIKGPASYNPATAARYSSVLLDNACFREPITPGSNTEARWYKFLDRMEPLADRVVLATVPDAVANARTTLILFGAYAKRVAGRYPVGFVLQDGAERPGMVPWDDIDAVFVGGSTEWKLSHHALYLCAEARARGLHVHMGRANGARRMMRAQSMQVDSCDGNLLAFAPTKNAARLARILARLPDTPQLALA